MSRPWASVYWNENNCHWSFEVSCCLLEFFLCFSPPPPPPPPPSQPPPLLMHLVRNRLQHFELSCADVCFMFWSFVNVVSLCVTWSLHLSKLTLFLVALSKHKDGGGKGRGYGNRQWAQNSAFIRNMSSLVLSMHPTFQLPSSTASVPVVRHPPWEWLTHRLIPDFPGRVLTVI